MRTSYLSSLLLSMILMQVICVAQKTENYVKGEVIVHFREGILDHKLLPATVSQPARVNAKDIVKNQEVLKVLEKLGVNGMRKLVRRSSPLTKTSVSRTGEEIAIPDFYNIMYVFVPENHDILTACKELNKLPGVLYAEPNYIFQSNFRPDDTFFAQQDALDEGFFDVDIDVMRAWDITTGSNVVRVGVIDTGINYDHEDLGAGFGSTAIKVKGGYDYANNDSNPLDEAESYHGTKCAGIIGALTNNNNGIAGIAGGNMAAGNPGVQLYALKVGQEDALQLGNVLEAIYDGSTSVGSGGYGCHILNFSAGKRADDTGVGEIDSKRKAVSYAAQNGTIFVASKGNNGSSTDLNPFYPADYYDNIVLSVGASDANDLRATNSNYGNKMDFVAPGTEDMILTTGHGQTLQRFSLTSASAAIVSGVAALMKSVNINLHRDDVENILQISTDKVGTVPYVNGYNDEMGHGRVNAGDALELLQAPWSLEHYTTTGAGSTWQNLSGDGEGIVFLNDANTTISEGWYYAQKYEVTKTINIPRSDCERYIWTRTVNATRGWSGANPNNNLGYSSIVSETATTVTLRTFVYYVKHDVVPRQINAWAPCAPQDVIFAYTTLYSGPPMPTSIIGDDYVCDSNKTYSLNENQPATWTNSSNLILASGQGTSSAQFRSSSSGPAWIKATIANECGDPIVITKNVHSGTETVNFSISANPDCASPGELVTFFADVPGPADYNWIISGGTLVDGGEESIWVRMDDLSMEVQCHVTGTSAANCYSPQGASVTYVEECWSFSASPNPASTSLTVELVDQPENTDPYKIEVRNSSGDVIKSHMASGNKFVINTKDIPNGMYILRILQKEGILSRRIIIEK